MLKRLLFAYVNFTDFHRNDPHRFEDSSTERQHNFVPNAPPGNDATACNAQSSANTNEGMSPLDDVRDILIH